MDQRGSHDAEMGPITWTKGAARLRKLPDANNYGQWVRRSKHYGPEEIYQTLSANPLAGR